VSLDLGDCRSFPGKTAPVVRDAFGASFTEAARCSSISTGA
jgi:hypothetical protein